MKRGNGESSGFFNRVIDLVNYRGSLAKIRFADNDSRVTETSDQSLLRRRIQAAAIVLLLAKVAFCVRSFALNGHAAPLDGLFILGLIVFSIWLYSPRNVSPFWMRVIEGAIFLGLSFQLGLTLHEQLSEITADTASNSLTNSDRAVVFVAAIKDQIIATFGLMMIYGMFIPNTPGRAALMVFLMAVMPAVVIVINQSSVVAIKSFRDEHVAVQGVFSGNLLALAVGAGCAIYGTAIMNRWRNRAIEAEQLGQYRLKEKIGSGGMGDVYLAEHRLLKRECAVKLIRSDLSEDPVMVNRFEREVQATATLSHWNTVQVFDYGQTLDGTFFYVMEHLHGQNLRQVVHNHGPFSEARTVFLLRQICEALREAAARGLVHRDIKPTNIFLARIGERFDVVKLLDFGLVRPLASVGDPELSGSNELKGSPRYMCPEQAQGESPDCRGDIYSLGATAFFMLTGRPPFDLQNALQLVIAHSTKKPPALSEFRNDLNTDLCRIVDRCLAKNPNDRFQNPDELLAALAEFELTKSWNWARAEQWWLEEDSGTTIAITGQSTVASADNALDETVIDQPQSGD